MADRRYVYEIVLTLFFLYGTLKYLKTSKVISILIDKSFGDITELTSKSNCRKAVMKTWFFALFGISYWATVYTFRSYNREDYSYLSEGTINGIIYIIGVLFMLSFYFYPLKLAKSEYYKFQRSKSPEDVILLKLQPSFMVEENEILKEFKLASDLNYFICEISQFKDLLQLNEPIEKIVWKPIMHTKLKDRQLLLTFLNKIFQNQMVTIPRKEVCQFINKYFEFNEISHLKEENPLKPDNIATWMKKN